ncbi:helix-turn-helix domain-containing protein [Bradyrhizobium genosp. L]|uniref:helix-turn-helix domain-containing protein n=1 Tax=Bradyrhizobium genosp. L TaxID=83637 RepID=UPI001FED6026|nr:helix-turn-helix transcriptional regulator [Bradyrhizobium genosp. L]
MSEQTNQRAEAALQELARAIDAKPGTRADFAKKVGIGQVYLSQILRGRRPIDRLPMGTVRKICDAAGVPIERVAVAPSLSPSDEDGR